MFRMKRITRLNRVNRSVFDCLDQNAYWQREQPDELGGEEKEEKGEERNEEAANLEASVHFGRALVKDATFGDALGKLARHETMLMSALTKTLQILLLLQSKVTRKVTH